MDKGTDSNANSCLDDVKGAQISSTADDVGLYLDDGPEPSTPTPSDFVVVHEIFRNVWSPGVKGIIRRLIAALPIARSWNVIDIGGIFAVATPRVTNVVEIIRPEHVAPETPTFGKPFIEHVHCAYADLVDCADVPASERANVIM